MKEIPNDCIDTIITDPPYGLEFMGKEWDKFKKIETWDSGKRETNFDGFSQPNNANRPRFQAGKPFYDFMYQWATEALRVAKPGSTLLCFGGTRTYHRLACAIEDAGWILKDCIMWLYGSGFPKASDISKQIDKKAGKLGIQGKGFVSAGHDGRKAEMKQTLKYRSDYGYRYKPKGEESQIWNGWKSHGLKPAYEPILVAMKPNEGSYANNALKWKVAGLNIDGGRIVYRSKEDEYHRDNKTASEGIFFREQTDYKLNRNSNNKGRYPANVILDEEAGRLLDEQSGKNCGAFAPVKKAKRANNVYGEYETFGDNGKTFRGDSGGASRFFYCAKASKAERNRGCEGLEIREAKTTQGLNSPNMRAERGRNPKETNRQNHHPTVKPLSLMKYLCTLTKTPTGGIVLDPFCGSGTTLMACKELKRDYIGIDNNPEYCEIARKRVNAIPESLF